MGKIVMIGEPMAMFVAKTAGKLKDVRDFQMFTAGAEVNVSVGAVRLGHEVEYITQLGKDPFGEYIQEYLEQEGIGTSFVQTTAEFPTGFQLKNKVAKNDPEVVYFRKGSAASHLGQELVEKIDFSDVDIFHVTGIFMALNDTTYELIKALIKKAKEQETLITFDPNLRPTLWASQKFMVERINEIASQADYVLPGIGEGFILTGYAEKEEIADFYLDRGAKGVIVKAGSNGAYAKCIQEDGRIFEQNRYGFKLAQVVDTVGAGDGFAVGVITGLLEQLPMEDILTRANAIGAIQVSHISDNENLPTREKLAAFIDGYKTNGGIE